MARHARRQFARLRGQPDRRVGSAESAIADALHDLEEESVLEGARVDLEELAVGVAIGLSSLARSVGVPLVSALFPIPKIALLPLFILWFGIGEPSKLATIGLGVFFPTAVAAFGAVDGVPRSLIRMAQSFGLPTVDIVRKVVLPGALPGILSGFRISASIALILVVAAEMINAQHGIGALVLFAGNLMRTDQLLAGVVVLSVLGLLVAWVLGQLERRLLRWR